MFSKTTLGGRAQTRGSRLCSWCDAAIACEREGSARGRELLTKSLRRFASSPQVLAMAWAKLSPEFRALPERAKVLKRERQSMMAADVVRQCRGDTVPHKTERTMCSICATKPVAMSLRSSIKKLERAVATHAAALGETRVPIERDADWMRICFANAWGAVAHCDVVDFRRM